MKKLSIITFTLLVIVSFKFFLKNEIENPASILNTATLKKPYQKKKSINISPKKIVIRKKNKIEPADLYKEKDKDFVPQDRHGNIYITTAMVVGEHIVAHGDIIVANIKDLEKLEDGDANLILPKPKRWESNSIPIKIENNLTNKPEIIKAINYIESKTHLKFPYQTNEEDYIFFKSGAANCYSMLGKTGGPQAIALAPGCKKGEVTHEILHALGFMHEQNREDRDQYIEIIWENIDEPHWLQFKKITNDFVDFSDFKFDFKSIMLYPPTTFSNSPGDYTIIKRNGDTYNANQAILSKGDIRKINFLYPKIVVD